MSITTKPGDEGMTSLLFGRRVHKCDDRVFACGAVDELSASLGVARSLILKSDPLQAAKILKIQNHLIVLMSEIMVLSADWERFKESKASLLTPLEIEWLETLIQELETQVAPSKSW